MRALLAVAGEDDDDMLWRARWRWRTGGGHVAAGCCGLWSGSKGGRGEGRDRAGQEAEVVLWRRWVWGLRLGVDLAMGGGECLSWIWPWWPWWIWGGEGRRRAGCGGGVEPGKYLGFRWSYYLGGVEFYQNALRYSLVDM